MGGILRKHNEVNGKALCNNTKWRSNQHRSQGIVERFNRTLADRLFSYQYHKEIENPSKSNREWVYRLQNVVSALSNEKTRLIEMKPIDLIP